MGEKLKATLPLALSIAVLAFLYVEFTANFTFHWVTSGDLVPRRSSPRIKRLPWADLGRCASAPRALR